MKITITLLITLFMAINGFAQNKDWAKAPRNPVPFAYTANHFGYNGNVALVSDGYTARQFNKDGFLEREYQAKNLTEYVYDENKFEETLQLLDSTSPYSLTGAIIAQDRDAIVLATSKLRNAAGNFYVNDKPTGAVVGQQPFGGARKSGTNDKAGSMINLYRWLSARTVKETFNAATDFAYPFLKEA